VETKYLTDPPFTVYIMLVHIMYISIQVSLLTLFLLIFDSMVSYID